MLLILLLLKSHILVNIGILLAWLLFKMADIIDLFCIKLHCPLTMASDHDWGRYLHTSSVFLFTPIISLELIQERYIVIDNTRKFPIMTRTYLFFILLSSAWQLYSISWWTRACTLFTGMLFILLIMFI
jgi:hypothetical protein